MLLLDQFHLNSSTRFSCKYNYRQSCHFHELFCKDKKLFEQQSGCLFQNTYMYAWLLDLSTNMCNHLSLRSLINSAPLITTEKYCDNYDKVIDSIFTWNFTQILLDKIIKLQERNYKVSLFQVVSPWERNCLVIPMMAVVFVKTTHRLQFDSFQLFCRKVHKDSRWKD